MTEKEIEKQLRNMPNIEDTRSKELILAKLMADDRVQKKEQMPAKRSRRFKWQPIGITLAALFFLSLLVPTILKGNEVRQMDIAADEMEEFATEQDQSTVIADDRKLLFVEDVVNYHLLKIGLVTNAISIPMTFLIPTVQIEKDFPDEVPNSIQLYQMYASKIPEEQLGFDAYHPYEGELIASNDEIMHKLPANHHYDEASAALSTYINSMKLTFSDYKILQPADLLGESIEFDQVGEVKSIELANEKSFLAYYRYELTSGQSVLVSNIGDATYDTVEQAVYGMKELNGDLFSSVVPENISYDVRLENETVTIHFTERLDLSTMAHEDARLMIEAFILTATDEYAHVQFENIVQDSWEGYDLTKRYAKPIAINPIKWTYD